MGQVSSGSVIRRSGALAGFLCAAFLAAAAHGECLAQADGYGRIQALNLDGEFVEVSTDLRLHHPDWLGMSALNAWSTAGTAFRESAGARSWTGTVPVGAATSTYEVILRETNGAVRVTSRLTAVTDVPLQAVHLHVGVPVRDFAGGTITVTGGVEPAVSPCPATAPAGDPHFLEAEGTEALFIDRSGGRTLRVRFDRPVPIAVQDERAWGMASYGLYVPLARGSLNAGRTLEGGMTLEAGGSVDRTPAQLTLGAPRRARRFEGFGGNYCFALDSPVTAYTLTNCRSHWARTEMKLREWAPRDADADDAAAWQACAANDLDGSDLHRGMLTAQALAQSATPLMISVWRLPEWLYAPANPPNPPRTVAADKWPAVRAAVGSYLLHMKTRYGVEPALFSFNEADAGVDVRLTPTEQTEMIRSFGAHFERLGLRTRLVAGDTTSARGSTVEFASAPLLDRAARRYVGAVAFHAWGGATPEEYAAWDRLARAYRLPLLAAEIGYDSDWRTVPAWFDTSLYVMRELHLLQDLLTSARVTGGMYWEFTGDYAPVRAVSRPGGPPVFEPTQRYANFRQFCNLTPSPARPVAATSSCDKVVVSAFDHGSFFRRGYVVHIANLGPERDATLTGLPWSADSLRAVRTSDAERCVDLPAVPVRRGTASLTLARHSLLTLTTQTQ